MSRVNLGQSFLCAIRGIFWAIGNDRNTKIHLVVGTITLLIAVLLRITRIELMIIAIISFLVISLELFNNCIERLIDVISPNHSSELGKIKDVLSGIVLTVDFLAVIIGLLIFYKPFIIMFNINPFTPIIELLVVNLVIIIACMFLFAKKKN